MSKPAELREQTDEQLDLLLTEVKHNLFRLRLQSETERLEAPSEIVKAKREIARIKTISVTARSNKSQLPRPAGRDDAERPTEPERSNAFMRKPDEPSKPGQ